MPDKLDDSESDPLLGASHNANGLQYATVARTPLEGDGRAFDDIPSAKRQLGLFSAVLLIFNRVIGTGIYATPSVILRSAGSPGVALTMWLAGALVAAAGTSVYVELGTGLPRSGGEKNYLEFMYRRPRFLATCAYAVYAVITGSAAANSVVFGEYAVRALALAPAPRNTRGAALLCLTFCLIVHGTHARWGVRLQNALGVFKLGVLAAVALLGALCLAGAPGVAVRPAYEAPRNLAWGRLWAGSETGANALVTGLYNVIWSFVGYSNANYALSEVREPVRTLRRAAPLAMAAVAAVYMLVNVAYFAVVSKGDILGSRQVVAALFFRNLFGAAVERALSVVIALSVLGNILAGQFSQGRVVQELGREGVLPYSAFFASNRPFEAPLSGLFTQYLLSCAFMLIPPPGDAYLFIINVSSYSLALINTLVSAGLLLLYTPAYRAWAWNPPFHAPKLVIVLFFLSNVFLIVVPLVPPSTGARVYDHLPYWLHVLVALSVSGIGVVYWYVWSVWLPRRNGYRLERRWVQQDGVRRYVFLEVRHVIGGT